MKELVINCENQRKIQNIIYLPSEKKSSRLYLPAGLEPYLDYQTPSLLWGWIGGEVDPDCIQEDGIW